MWSAIVAIVSLGVACALWVLLQRWIARIAPDLPSIERSCTGCAHETTCDQHCETASATREPSRFLPKANLDSCDRANDESRCHR